MKRGRYPMPSLKGGLNRAFYFPLETIRPAALFAQAVLFLFFLVLLAAEVFIHRASPGLAITCDAVVIAYYGVKTYVAALGRRNRPWNSPGSSGAGCPVAPEPKVPVGSASKEWE